MAWAMSAAFAPDEGAMRILDPRPRGFDGLGMAEEGQAFRGDQHLDASRHPGLTADQAGALQGQDHLVHGRRRDLEMTLHVGLGRGATMNAGVGIDEGQVLALPVSEALFGHSPHARFIG
ncbi:MAG: hypothetical protein K0Q60_3465 [Microvirga sp.]|nr:hypothetical protein [Microvirga sp.]